jgi:hypothetical protein
MPSIKICYCGHGELLETLLFVSLPSKAAGGGVFTGESAAVD